MTNLTNNLYKTPVIGFIAPSGTGKTTLIEKIIPLLLEKKIRSAVIKHTHHDFEIDQPNKDSFKIRKSGALETLIVSNNRWALIHENNHNFDQKKCNLNELILKLDLINIELIIIEGFKYYGFPRIELHRKELNNEFLFNTDPNIIAVASDDIINTPSSIPGLDLNNSMQIIDFILNSIKNNEYYFSIDRVLKQCIF